MASSITFKSVAKKYKGNTILADLSFGVEEKSAFALIGKNNSGKSLILRLLSGLSRSDKGNIYIKGQDIQSRSSEIQSIIGYMPQSNYLNRDLKAVDNLSVFCNLNGIKKQDFQDQLYNWTDRLKLTKSDLNFYPKDLSFEKIRKIVFIRSILHNPSILLLDDPTRGLDTFSSALIWEVVESFKKTKSIIFTTSDLDAVEKYADRIGIIHEGSIKMLGTIDSLINSMEGISLYEIDLENQVNDDIMNKLIENKKILNPELNGSRLSFYSRERKHFFAVLKDIINFGIKEIKFNEYRLTNLIENMIGG